MNDLMTKDMTTEEIIELAVTRSEIPWDWGCRLNHADAETFAKDNGLVLEFGMPVRPGDLYIAKRNQGWKLLECLSLGDAWVQPTTWDYPYDFSECVKVIT